MPTAATARSSTRPRSTGAAPAAKGLTYRQQPGPENPLGFVKINFHNAHSVYMHDTPWQSLFGRNFRAASSGCVRVHGIEQLAAWLMAEQGWKPEHVQADEGRRASGCDVKLKKPMPLYFVYITAWATEDGVVQFRRDIYQKDGIGQRRRRPIDHALAPLTTGISQFVLRTVAPRPRATMQWASLFSRA